MEITEKSHLRSLRSVFEYNGSWNSFYGWNYVRDIPPRVTTSQLALRLVSRTSQQLWGCFGLCEETLCTFIREIQSPNL